MPDALPSIELEPGALVIADLHLDVASDDTRESSFERWVARQAPRPPRLIVLGDLFDAWIGPAQMELASARRVLDALARLTAAGTRVDVLRGNRDFLLDERFERRSGCRVHAGGLIGVDDGARTLFIHGDELCTLDRGYQRLRRVLRSPAAVKVALGLPRGLALWTARRLRRASTRALAMKPAAEKEQQVGEAQRLVELHGCTRVVCGHAHVYRDEPLAGGCRWLVLGAFGGPNDVLHVGADGRLRVGGTLAAA